MSENLKSTTVSSQGFEYGVKHFLAPDQGLARDQMIHVLNLSQPEVEFLFKLGSVYINNHRWLDWDFKCNSQDHIRVHTKPRRYCVDLDWTSFIVFNHEDFIVINKPHGLPCHPSVDNQIENSLTQMSLALKESLFITHRLDSLTSGLLVYSKNALFTQTFNQLFKVDHQNLHSEKKIQKKYIAHLETDQELPSKLIHYMERSPRAPKKLWSFPPDLEPTQKSDYCELHIEEQKQINTQERWVKINLITGRTHQIRSQCAEVGAPVVGDEMYGAQLKLEPKKIKLRSQELSFIYQNQKYHFQLDDHF